jgi:peptidoglycan/xylan/chitin deacetylase (PgdA/CDA1 family)
LPSADQKVVCLVFDDGWKSQLHAVPILQSLGFNATFAIVTSYNGYPAYMNWADVASLAKNGMDIASHTDTHVALCAVDNATLSGELAKSQQALRLRGYPADVFVYPYGDAADNETVRVAVAQYYSVARGTEEGQCGMTCLDRYNLNAYGVYNDTSLADFASYLNGTQGNTVTILYYHQISDEIDYTAVTQASFQAQMQYLKDNGCAVESLSQLFLKPLPTNQ